MTNKTAAEKAIEKEQALQEKVLLKALVIRKTMTRKDWREAVEALDEAQEDWSEIDTLIVFARKVSGKAWDDLFDLTQEELEAIVLA